MSSRTFHEVQIFRESPMLYVLVISLGLAYGGMFFAIYNDPDEGKINSMEVLIASAILLVVFFVIMWVALIMKLEVRIDQSGVFYKMPPIINAGRTIHFDDIENYEIVNYRPIMHHGGWGARHSLKGGKVFTISGKNGLKLQLKSGKSILLGTKIPEEIKRVIDEIWKEKRDG